MTPLFFLLYVIYMASVGPQVSKVTYPKHKALPCDGHQAHYNRQAVMGTWYMVAVIPGPKMPNMRYAPCYKMELSETDVAGIEWLVRKKIQNPRTDFIKKLNRTIVRQRFYSEKPFDIWSKRYYSTPGCFRQLLALEINNTNVADGVYYDNFTLLHLFDIKDGGPYLLQLFWDRMISAIVYRRAIGVSLERLEPIHEFVSQIRGHQLPPRICDLPLKPIPRFPFQRP